jgi:hypothetical protein
MTSGDPKVDAVARAIRLELDTLLSDYVGDEILRSDPEEEPDVDRRALADARVRVYGELRETWSGREGSAGEEWLFPAARAAVRAAGPLVRYLVFCCDAWDDDRPTGWDACILQSSAETLEEVRLQLEAECLRTKEPAEHGQVYPVHDGIGEDYHIVSAQTWEVVERGKVALRYASDENHFDQATVMPGRTEPVGRI